MPTTIDSAGITFNDATSLTSAVIPANAVGATQIANGSVTAAKLGTTEQKQIAKAWVNFNGTLATPITPRASFNVSSVTKNGTGDYTVNFPVGALADANYALSINGYQNTAGANFIGSADGRLYTTTQVRIATDNSAFARTDMQCVTVIIFGN
jgi:hypothetical protein